MTKKFCDFCGDEITKRNEVAETGNRLMSEITGKNGTRLAVEILVIKDGAANRGDFCKYCILKALNKLDDRPKPT